MGKGAILTEQFVEEIGLSDRLFTLKNSIKNIAHPETLEPVFHVQVEEIDEVIYLEKQYIYQEQLDLKPSYGKEEKILLWTYRADRFRNNDTSNPPVTMLLASAIFLMNDTKEFQRFRIFLKESKLRDVQARSFIEKHSTSFAEFAKSEEGVMKVIDAISGIRDWPGSETGYSKNTSIEEQSVEGVAKYYSEAFVSLRSSSFLCTALLNQSSAVRVHLFRLFCYAEDKGNSATSTMEFLRDLGIATKDNEVIRATASISSGMDFSKALKALRIYLMSEKIP